MQLAAVQDCLQTCAVGRYHQMHTCRLKPNTDWLYGWQRSDLPGLAYCSIYGTRCQRSGLLTAPKQARQNSQTATHWHVRSAQQINLLIPSNKIPFEKVILPQLVNKFLEFYGIQSVITVVTITYSLSMSAKLIQSTCSRPISLRSILISSSIPSQGLPSSLLPSCHRMKNLYTYPFFATRTTLARVREDEDSTCGTRAILLILLNFITSVKSGNQYKSWSTAAVLCTSVPYAYKSTGTAAVLCALVLNAYKTTSTAAVCVL